MNIRNKNTAAKAATTDEEAAQDQNQPVTAPDSPLGDLSSPAEYTARAQQIASEATAGLAFTEDRRGQAQELIAAARAEAAAIIGAAEALARELGKEADQREREIRGLAERASLLRNVAANQEQAIAEARKAVDLAERRERLSTRLDELDGTLARLRADKQDAETQLAEARSSADVKRARDQQGELEAIEGVIATQTAERAEAQSKFAAIGDGALDSPGQFADALKAVQAHQLEVHRILNVIFPDRPEARLDAAQAELMGAIEGNLARITEEAKAKPRPRQIVHL